jgi:flagellar motor protein MotB
MTSTQNPLMQLQADNQINPALRPGKDPGQSKNKGDAGKKDKRAIAKENAKNQRRAAEQRKFEETQRAIQKAVEASPELKALAKNLLVDTTPEGLRIQVIDQDGESMFASGSAEMYEKTRQLLGQVAEIVKSLPNDISVRGHTDGVPYGQGAAYTNWELSADRANASRRVLLGSGIGDERLNNVVGKADTEHLVPDNPADPKNRRISIMLLREELTDPDYFKDLDAQFGEEDIAEDEETGEEIEGEETEGEGGGEDISPSDLPQIDKPFEEPLFEPTPGQVQFP